jgi:hypothetical protein
MKRTLLAVAFAMGLPALLAQERLPREEALKYAFYLCQDLKELQGTPIPTDVDVKRPVGVHEGEYGGLVLPEAKLSREIVAKAGEQPVPIGQLWLHRLTPIRDGQPVAAEDLRLVKVTAKDGQATLPQCALALRKNSAGAFELCVYGKAKEPILKVPAKAIEAAQELPVELDAERTGEGGRVILRILGRYEARFDVTDLSL